MTQPNTRLELAQSEGIHTPVKPSTAVIFLLLAAAAWGVSTPAHADILASKSGKCPSNYTPYMKYGDMHCKTPEKAVKKSAEKPAAGRSSGSGGSSGGVYVEPVLASVQKAAKAPFCPTGYNTNEAQCVSSWDGAPKTTLKSGPCPVGTLEEHGAYCTASMSDNSDAALDRIDGFAVRDFNVVYTQALVDRVTPPEQKIGAVHAALLAQRVAAGTPWLSRPAREAAKPNPQAEAQARQLRAEQGAKDLEFAKACAQIRAATGGQVPVGSPCANVAAPTDQAFSGDAVNQAVAGVLGQTGGVTPEEAAKEAAKQAIGNKLKGLFGR